MSLNISCVMLHLFLSRITQESNSTWVWKHPIHNTNQSPMPTAPCAIHEAEPTLNTHTSVQLGTHKGKMSEMQITLENFSGFQCYLKSTMIDWNFSLELISTQIGPSIQCYFPSIQTGGCWFVHIVMCFYIDPWLVILWLYLSWTANAT